MHYILKKISVEVDVMDCKVVEMNKWLIQKCVYEKIDSLINNIE